MDEEKNLTETQSETGVKKCEGNDNNNSQQSYADEYDNYTPWE